MLVWLLNSTDCWFGLDFHELMINLIDCSDQFGLHDSTDFLVLTELIDIWSD